ncbi:hypothetical protein B0H14DRAFT_2582437 [Mycena olivaceomarginata]|nr:hypothetical protein B0H14DRAFT_2582437 [Mycena olivaceomarginata]
MPWGTVYNLTKAPPKNHFIGLCRAITTSAEQLEIRASLTGLAKNTRNEMQEAIPRITSLSAGDGKSTAQEKHNNMWHMPQIRCSNTSDPNAALNLPKRGHSVMSRMWPVPIPKAPAFLPHVRQIQHLKLVCIWHKITCLEVDQFIAQMPAIFEAVIAIEGGHTS